MKSRFLSVLAGSCLFASSLANASAKGFDLKLAGEGFVSPTTLVSLPNSNGSLLVADQAGVVHVVSKEGKMGARPFLDLRGKLTKLNEGFDERGLLSLALHPKFAENKKVYVVYSAPRREQAPKEWDHTMRLSEFTAAGNGRSAALDSEKVVLEVDKPYFNHNGGNIEFGPDGYLYMSVGDGGNGNDRDEPNKPKGRPPEGNAQNLQTHLGKILRIDVNSGSPYAVPQDNPFVGKENARPEIYAYGMRNPWRISFDRGGNHELFAADVGQDGFEEIDIIVKGGNYGWNLREGFHCFNPNNSRKTPEDCPKVGANGEPLLDPIMEYKNLKNNPDDGKGISITGGFVYRGKAIPEWNGKYIFADWSAVWVKPQGVLFAGSKAQDGKWKWEVITPAKTRTDFYITGFGEDAEGELYILTNSSNGLTGTTGKVFKLVPQ